ncbi:MAG TPA: hypothetical protein VL333_13140 [Candidatus Saccharimonadales bacterium]|jgi:hypothetical protein|nr:hypothetical protein [Candidatus Saccharimonadales bacterium]
MVRDVQKSKVYRAERRAREVIGDKAIQDRIAAWAFVEKVERDAWFRKHYGRWRFRISDGRGTRIARGGGGWLNLPRWSRTPVVMLHEIAHNVAPSDAWHDWRFCQVHLALVRHFLGREAHDVLRAMYRECKVRYKRPRRISAATRAALVERLAGLRAANEEG